MTNLITFKLLTLWQLVYIRQQTVGNAKPNLSKSPATKTDFDFSRQRTFRQQLQVTCNNLTSQLVYVLQQTVGNAKPNLSKKPATNTDFDLSGQRPGNK